MMNKFKNYLRPVAYSNGASTALLLVRLLAGVAFVIHGWSKIQVPMAWMGPDAPVPGIFQLLAAVSEFGGGIGWILGLFTPIASFGILCTMIVATLTHAVMMQDPFISTGGASYELASLYLVISFLFLMVGPGKFSADYKIFGERK